VKYVYSSAFDAVPGTPARSPVAGRVLAQVAGRPWYRPAMGWEPVLEGRLAEEAWAAARQIAEQIEEVVPADRPSTDLALFWAYAAGAFEDEASLSRYDAAVERLAEHVERGFRSLSLYGGLAGAGWVLAHISDEGHEFLGEVDARLIAELEVTPWRADYDLIQGLVGLGVYFCERLRGGAASARRGIERVVEQLAATAERSEDAVTWYTAPELLVPWQREQVPTGYYNLGVAHGVPGVIAMLGAVAALPEPELAATRARARELCDGAIRWLRAQRLPPDPKGRFASWIHREPREPSRSRNAWCYGDAGIAAAAWSAASRTGAEPGEWQELALEAAQRPAELCLVMDPNLCHGAAGLAHLCNRFYQASGDARFRAAARGWFERALALRRPGEGIAGFTAWRPPDDGDAERSPFHTSHDFLDGTAGVGLALLAGLRAEEPGWDRLLLCDLPPREPR